MPLLIGSTIDPLEAAAEHAAATSDKASISNATAPRSGQEAPPIVREALAAPGHPLATPVRTRFEARYQHNFSGVRLHSDGVAARSAAAIGAQAYTVGEHIVLGSSASPPAVLAHELAHVVQQSSASMPWVQRQPLTNTPPAPRKDFVFLMGEDKRGTKNPFFEAASIYFHAHVPAATFVTDQRTMEGLLNWISANVKDPIGNLYIVSHGNEDGTLSFGIGSSAKMMVLDLRNALHPSGGGPSSLPSLPSNIIDEQTTIHIKGCDIGRTREMVVLIDEAFGGKATVTAPTHEQKYQDDPALGAAARKTAHDQQMSTFTAGLPALPPKPAAVDPKLKGDARKKAQADFKQAEQALKKAQDDRTKAIADEEKRIKPGLDTIEKEAGVVDSLSGPMFQRPGTKLFTEGELKPDIDRLYGHLSEDQRKSLAKNLVARDRGVKGDQQGQKIDRLEFPSAPVEEPASLQEVLAIHGKELKDDHFQAKSIQSTRKTGPSGTELTITISGVSHPPDKDPFDDTRPLSLTIPDDKSIIDGGKAKTNNPDRYAWHVERRHASSGFTTLVAVGERVVAYLHHGSLDAAPHDHFSKPESDANFYTTVTPPPPPPAGSGTTKP
ncbi:DUF4157 domain-containing protein [Dyella silvae]|uniref:eCIS core domain-containing protein n=1 Tax=Dyella silvae TaxID=2994424 RepID=UPI00226528E3|nr:DUF4157 domain-containing protein [Dyella silvae]